ncbi:ABC transporter substrate-binding protein [Euzebya pacifica]|uniref:ABC transporter substrate-binding protein n=1 Tax=Euzebya pacifica TaxID=1608957 RepID=UPI000DF7426F|nr:ABC transporter substrate-binding protein [Euzebya pacifica]
MKSKWIWCGMLVFALLAGACGDGSGDEVDDGASSDGGTDESLVEEVTLRYAQAGTMTPTNTAQVAIPEVLGYWAEEGVVADQSVMQGSGEVVQALDAGNIDVTITTTAQAASAIAQGSPLRIIASYVNGNIWTPFVPEDSPIQEVEDLAGTTVGVPNLESGAVPTFGALLGTVGLGLDDVDLVAAGTGPEVVALLESGQIDVYAASDGHQALVQREKDMRGITNDAFGEIGFHVVMVARDDVVEEHRTALVGLMRGLFKGIVVARENPEAGVAMLYQVFPDNQPTGMSDEEVIEAGLPGLLARLANIQPVDGLEGNTTDEQIRAHLEFLIANGDLETDDLDGLVAQMWDPSLLEEANDFDRDAIVEQAATLEWQAYLP